MPLLAHLFSGNKDDADRTRTYKDAGAALKDYDIGAKLGEGGYGIVNQVHERSKEVGVDVAVKAVPLKLVMAQGGGLDFVHKRLARLRKFNEKPHKNIIHILDFRLTKRDLFIFLELCTGQDMFERVTGTDIDEEGARKAARSLCEAVAHCHANGIVHRDVKPENLFFRHQDAPLEELVLADFSCMFEAGPSDAITGFAGSNGYMAPEIIKGEAYHQTVDEWSVGICCYQMLSKRTPFRSEDGDAIRKETIERDIPYPRRYWSSLSPEALHFTQSLLQKDPKKRMLAADALKHPWLTGSKMPAAETQAPSEKLDDTASEEQREPVRSGSADVQNSRPCFDRPQAISHASCGPDEPACYDLRHIVLNKVPGAHLLRLQELDAYLRGDGTKAGHKSESEQ